METVGRVTIMLLCLIGASLSVGSMGLSFTIFAAGEALKGLVIFVPSVVSGVTFFDWLWKAAP